MVKNTALKTVMRVVLSHNIAWKKTIFCLRKNKACNTQRLPVESVVSKSPPTGSKRLARKPLLNLNLSKPEQERMPKSTSEAKEKVQAKH